MPSPCLPGFDQCPSGGPDAGVCRPGLQTAGDFLKPIPSRISAYFLPGRVKQMEPDSVYQKWISFLNIYFNNNLINFKMNKFRYCIIAALIMAAGMLTGCDEDDPEIFDPPSVMTSAGGNIQLDPGVDEYTVNGTAQSSAPLMDIRLIEITDDGEFQIGNRITSFENPVFHQFSFPITGITRDMTVRVRVTDTQDQTAMTDPISIFYNPLPAETPLSEAADTVWRRTGSAAGTGLADFGLAWTSNVKTVKAVIRKDGAEKFVQLDAADWEEIETLEELMEKVDEAEDMTDYRGVSAMAPGSYNDVLATIHDGQYYLILVESATVQATDDGTVITISVKFKTAVTEETEE
jgi:hypothetical protein